MTTGLAPATPDTQRDMVVIASGLASGALDGRRDMDVAVVVCGSTQYFDSGWTVTERRTYIASHFIRKTNNYNYVS